MFLYSVFPEHYFGIFTGISSGIFSEYTQGNVPRIFHEHIFAWRGSLYSQGYTPLKFLLTLRFVSTDVKDRLFSIWHIWILVRIFCKVYSMKILRIRFFSLSVFPVFGLTTEMYYVNLSLFQPKYRQSGGYHYDL